MDNKNFTQAFPVMETLISLIHGLPPELFNGIRDLVFTSNEKKVIINEEYTPSNLLQVSSHTRQQYAYQFYGGETEFVPSCPDTLARFLKSLTKAHRGLIQHISLQVSLHAGEVGSNCRRDYEMGKLAFSRESWLKRCEKACLQYLVSSLNRGDRSGVGQALRFTYDDTLDGDHEKQLRAWVGLGNGWRKMIKEYKDQVNPGGFVLLSLSMDDDH